MRYSGPLRPGRGCLQLMSTKGIWVSLPRPVPRAVESFFIESACKIAGGRDTQRDGAAPPLFRSAVLGRVLALRPSERPPRPPAGERGRGGGRARSPRRGRLEGGGRAGRGGGAGGWLTWPRGRGGPRVREWNPVYGAQSPDPHPRPPPATPSSTHQAHLLLGAIAFTSTIFFLQRVSLCPTKFIIPSNALVPTCCNGYSTDLLSCPQRRMCTRFLLGEQLF